MNSVAVVSMSIGEAGDRISSLTFGTQKKYADRIKADFLCIRARKYYEKHLFWEKLQLREILSRYERVLYLDADVIVRNDALDIFAVVPKGHVAALNENADGLRLMNNPRLDYEGLVMRSCDAMRMKRVDWFEKFYLNMGVLVIDKAHKGMFLDPPVFLNDFMSEQNYLNIRVRQLNYPIFQLPDTFPRTYYSPKPRLDAHVVHYAGAAYKVGYAEEIPFGKGLDYLITQDLKYWDSKGLLR